jgi:2-polyprenyl-3-methyl-5-hydroxy-6-metoxy-1,4-benzoquinol methylase
LGGTRVTIPHNVTKSDLQSSYALGYTDSEHQRLIRQAAMLAPLTESFFRDSGIGPGHRILDLGSGMGDVAMVAARLVGSSGEVVGIERDPNSTAVAAARAAEAGFHNVSFTQTDASQITCHKPFDAAVGRFILQFLPDPAAVLRSLAKLLRPGGVVAFLEPQWSPYLDLLRPFPLSFACASVACEAFHRSGVRTDLGLDLHGTFQRAGLPAPTMQLRMALGADRNFAAYIGDLLYSLLPKAREHGISLEKLGGLDTLSTRILAEVAAANTVVPIIALVGACSRIA